MSSTIASLETSAAKSEPQRAAPSRRHGPSPRTVLAIASLGAAVAFVDATIVNIAFPDIERSFPGTPISSLSWVLNAYNIVFAAFLVAAGRIADLIGRRRMFVLGLEVFTVASLLCAIAPSPDALIAFRVLQALGAACLVPAALALVLNAFPPAQRSHGVALLSAVAAASAGLGPSLGGVLIAIDDWRLVFLVNLPIGAAAAVLARRRLVESRTPGRRRLPDLSGAVLFALAIAALVLGVVKGEDWGWSSAGIVISFVVAVALALVFLRRCSRHRSPIIDLGLLRIRTFSAANAMTIVTAAGFYGYTLANVLFLTGVWRYSTLDAGLALTPGPFVAAAVAGPTSRLVQRFGPRPVRVAGGLIWGGGVLWFVERVGATPDFLGLWLPGIVMLGVGAGTLLPNLSAVAVASAPGESFATATGLNSVARQVGAALGVAVVVAIIGTPTPSTAVAVFHDAWTFGAACLIGAAIGCLLVSRVPVQRTPTLGDAARLVMHEPPPPPPVQPPRPRTRRAVVVDPADPAPLRAESAADFLALVPLFAGLEPAQRQAIATRTRSVRVEAGRWLFREGETGDAMYIVRAGRLKVIDERAATTVRELGRGDWVGELAMLTGAPRSASVRAERSSDLLAVARRDFEQLIQDSPPLSLALASALAEQLREARAAAPRTRPLATAVALVALDDRVPLAELARGLSAQLEDHRSIALLDGSEAAPPAPGHGPATVYGPLLDRAEAGHDLVLLSAGAALAGEPWTEFCLQQADRILAVTAGGAVPPRLSERPELGGCDLVGYDVVPGSGALAGWVAALEPIESHVVRGDQLAADLGRLARRLSGRSVGIVLSGGGARAFSHIGVLEELTAAGVVIDRVAGMSMGAFIGGLFAMGLDGEEMDRRCFEEWVQRRPLRDYTLPRQGLIRGARVEAMLERTFNTVAIEELARSFLCGATDLRSGELVLSRYGLLWEAVGLSINIPIIAPPRVRGANLLIDGSLTDNLPVQPMAELGEGPIIAVDVKMTFNPEAEGHRAPPAADRPARVPSLGETLTRVLLLGSANTSDMARRYADVVIRPRTGGIGLLEFHQLDEAREAGRVATSEMLEASSAHLFS
jgi:NTE family protein